jgi:phosphatidylinositol kinase/protein kinase (PI-3  family)
MTCFCMEKAIGSGSEIRDAKKGSDPGSGIGTSRDPQHCLQGLAGKKSPTVVSTINEVLAKLLIVGITDGDADVRLSVLESLNDCFDFHLAQAENLSALFIALNDEQFEIRELALCALGRLSILNPAYIMPSLRKTLIQLLIELEHSGLGRNKEQASRLLGHLVANAPKLIRPYVEPILKVGVSFTIFQCCGSGSGIQCLFTPRIRDPDPG